LRKTKLKKAIKFIGFSILLFIQIVSFASVQSKWQDWDKRNNTIIALRSVNPDSAMVLANQLLAEINDPIDTLIYSQILMNKGHLHFNKGEFVEASEFYLRTLKIREKTTDFDAIANAEIALANLNYYTQSYSTARFYVVSSINHYQMARGSPTDLAACYNLLGLLHYNQDRDDSAIFYYNQGISILDEDSLSKPIDYYQLYDNKGAALVWLGQYEEGIYYLKKNIGYLLEMESTNNLAWKYNQITNAYINWERLDSAQRYLSLSEDLIAKAVSIEVHKDILYTKLLYAIAANDKPNTILYLEEYNELSNQLITEKTKKSIQESVVKFQTEKKEAALQLSIEKAKKLALENKAKNQLLLLALAGVFILAILALYIYRSFKHKSKLDQLELQIKDARLDELLYDQESKAYAAILQGQETERERIAQDLHDRLGGTLAALKLALRKPTNKVEPDDLAIIDLAVNEVRSIAHNLSTGLVHKYGLNEAVTQLFRTLEQTKGIEFNLFLHPKTPSLGQAAGIELYRIIQELVSNTLKHAKATEISLQTNFSENTFNLIFEDNGVGFDPKQLSGGIGLENIKVRVKRLGGELHIDSEKGRGSIFIVELKK